MFDRNDIPDKHSSAPSYGADDAVGVPKAKWFIAIVNSRSEKKYAEMLTKMGIENDVPIQTVTKVWKNGKKAKVDHVVISCIIFIHCTEKERREIVALPFINRFMTNKSGTSTNGFNKPVAVASEIEIKQLKFMLGNSDSPVEISNHIYNIGEKVRVARGRLKGLEGTVVDLRSTKCELIVALETLGCAKLIINTTDLELIK